MLRWVRVNLKKNLQKNPALLGLAVFYGISSLVGYLMQNPVNIYI